MFFRDYSDRMDKKFAETGGTEGEDKQESPGAELVPESGENRNQGTDSTQKETARGEKYIRHICTVG